MKSSTFIHIIYLQQIARVYSCCLHVTLVTVVFTKGNPTQQRENQMPTSFDWSTSVLHTLRVGGLKTNPYPPKALQFDFSGKLNNKVKKDTLHDFRISIKIDSNWRNTSPTLIVFMLSSIWCPWNYLKL